MTLMVTPRLRKKIENEASAARKTPYVIMPCNNPVPVNRQYDTIGNIGYGMTPEALIEGARNERYQYGRYRIYGYREGKGFIGLFELDQKGQYAIER